MSHAIYTLDGVFTHAELRELYQRLIRCSCWSLATRSSTTKGLVNRLNTFAGMHIMKQGKVLEPDLLPIFVDMVARVRERMTHEYSLALPEKIARIQINARNAATPADLHRDNGNAFARSIVCFLTPMWTSSNGGGLRIEEEIVDYVPGRAVVFPSLMQHKPEDIMDREFPFWRLAVNVLLYSAD